jgi:hypothetical protein
VRHYNRIANAIAKRFSHIRPDCRIEQIVHDCMTVSFR